MGTKRIDEVYGTLGKSELLYAIHDKIIHGSLVFESLSPFPGYYNNQENDIKPVYLYLALDHEYSVFDIERAKLAVKKNYNWRFESAKGKIDLYDKHFDVVRLRHLDSFDQLIPIQSEFIKAGLKLKMNTLNHVNNEKGYIQLMKIFNISKLGKGIYIDATEDYHAYLVIPRKLTPTEFEETTLKVKYNWESTGFDAAAGCFFIRGKLKEMVRIFSKDLNVEYLEELRKLYLSKMGKKLV